MKLSDKIIPVSILFTVLLIIACSKDQEDPPNAAFEASISIARIGDTIYFQNTSTGGNQFEWDFGDGNFSSEENPWHIYSQIGNYRILLKVSNSAGSRGTTKDIRISYWSACSEIPTTRGTHSSSVVDGKIYVISGGSHYGGGALHAVEEYNPETNTWTTKSDIPTARQGLSTSVVGGKIYAIGGGESPILDGYKGTESFATVEVYDPATDTWDTKSPMPSSRWVHCACVVDQKIYIIGGSVSFPFNYAPSMMMYDPATDTWSEIGNIPRPMVCSVAAAVNGKIYIIGGDFEGNFNRVDEYDPVTKTWTRKKDMPTKRDDMSCTVMDGKIYVIGGESETYAVLNTVEVYDPKTDTWANEDPLLTRRWTHSSCKVNDKIYVISGFSKYIPFYRYVSLNKVEVFYK